MASLFPGDRRVSPWQDTANLFEKLSWNLEQLFPVVSPSLRSLSNPRVPPCFCSPHDRGWVHPLPRCLMYKHIFIHIEGIHLAETGLRFSISGFLTNKRNIWSRDMQIRLLKWCYGIRKVIGSSV